MEQEKIPVTAGGIPEKHVRYHEPHPATGDDIDRPPAAPVIETPVSSEMVLLSGHPIQKPAH